jgi:NADPH:quinone reductase-like Zn-dependent oxidoreductase
MDRMLAAVRDRYGGPEVVRIEPVAVPEPRADEVLVRVETASVNRADLDLVWPKPPFMRLFLGPRRPRNPGLGCDVAGTVAAVGSAVTRFRPGDRVFADLYPFGSGAFAEFACAPERAFQLIPDGLDTSLAATLPHAGILAFQGLHTRDGSHVESGARVLIDGASGNVGPFAVQIARSMGAVVSGVCSPAKADFVRSLGADEVIDYTTADAFDGRTRYDWILAAESHHSIARVRRALRPGGRYVTLGGSVRSLADAMVVGPLVGLTGSRRAGMMLWWKPFDPDDVAALAALVLDGHVRPAVDRRFPLAELPEALRRVEDGLPLGKVLIEVP